MHIYIHFKLSGNDIHSNIIVIATGTNENSWLKKPENSYLNHTLCLEHAQEFSKVLADAIMDGCLAEVHETYLKNGPLWSLQQFHKKQHGSKNVPDNTTCECKMLACKQAKVNDDYFDVNFIDVNTLLLRALK